MPRFHLRYPRAARAALLGVLACAVAGCASYAAPGPGANLAMITGEDRQSLTDPNVQVALDRKPLAKFPAGVAVVRVQAPQYESRTATSYGRGAFSVVTTRDVEKDETVDRLARLPQVSGIATIGRLLLPASLTSDRELRQAAAQLNADMLLVYTLDTSFYVRDMAKPLSVVSLGLSPNQQARVVTTASAVLMDTRNGYVYGMAEATERNERLANGWTSEDAIDAARLKTESRAFEKLVGNLETTWKTVVARYAPPIGAPAAGG
jgi:hypothetical protein